MDSLRLASKIRLAYLGAAILASALPIPAAADSWFKYENNHFVTYSDADQSKVITLLDNLERFRGAVLQVSNITVPASAPKTLVLITEDKSTFARLRPSRNVAGFAMSVGEQTLIVLPASGSTSWAHSVIRHEYGHALLRFKNFSYPTWYEEGFAEMVSATHFKDEGQAFTLGDAPERAKDRGKLPYNWDTLVSDDFEPHTIQSPQRASGAYFQAWLLAHYTTLGDDGKNAAKLQSYFTLLKNGQSSETAFRNAFSKSAADLWKSELKPYAKRVPVYVLKFSPGILDTDFTRTSAQPTEIEPILKYLEIRSTLSNREKLMPAPLELLAGDWGVLSIESSCNNPGAISVDRDNRTITFQHFHLAHDGQWRAESFSYATEEGGRVMLSPTHAARALGVTALRIEMPSENLLCIRSTDLNEANCYGIMTRCD